MQVATSGVKVHPTPAYLDPRPHEDSHTLIIEFPDRLRIPLTLDGATSSFPSRKPTLSEYENADVIYHLTDADVEWDPHDPCHADAEEAFKQQNHFPHTEAERSIAAVTAGQPTVLAQVQTAALASGQSPTP